MSNFNNFTKWLSEVLGAMFITLKLRYKDLIYYMKN